MRVQWQENGIVLTAVAIVAAALLILSEQLVASRTQSPMVITIDAGTDGDDEADERTAASATVPLYGSLAELTVRAQQLQAEPGPNVDLLQELARQARGFRAFGLAESLLARSLELVPGRVDTQFMRARNQSDLGHPELAMQMYEAVLVQAPSHQKATYNLGVLARRAGDLKRAEAQLTRAIAISSGRVKSKALNQLGLTYGAAGRWDLAAQSLNEAVNLRPDMARFWLDLGNAELKRGRLNEAQVAFDKALALNRRFADAHVAMGLLQELRGNQARALSHLTRAVKLDSDNTEYRKALARNYLSVGDASRAREEFGWLSRSADNEADRAYAQSMQALLDHNSDRMLSELKRANTLRPGGYDDAVEQAAIVLHEKKQYKEARALLDMLLARPSPTPEVQLAAARTASRLGQWADAEDLLRRSLKSRPENSEAWFQLGRALSERGDLAGAIDAYRQSLERNPDARNTRLNLAVLHARSGNEREALNLYEQLLKDHPRYTPALVNRARLHGRAGRNPEALADLEMAMRAAPGDPEIRARLAELLLRQGQTDRARVLLADAVAESPADPEVRLLLADTELRAGRRAAALKELGRAAALAGDDPRIWSLLAQHYRDAGDMAAAAQANSRATRLPGAPAPPKASP
ncbi:MAG: tetratricopeptide repeat protein [Steroidobacteraceae bacterium]|nr:tetratricopeptide repeat protein [Steroidobacteraceae bacterium]